MTYPIKKIKIESSNDHDEQQGPIELESLTREAMHGVGINRPGSDNSHAAHFDTRDDGKIVRKPIDKRITELLHEHLTTKISMQKIRPVKVAQKMEGDVVSLGMHDSFFVEGVKIGWPYPVVMTPQRQMAMHLVKALKNSRHVVMESPTGTGKSAAILCSVLAWQRWHQQRFHSKGTAKSADTYKPPTIIYCSRTHSQVAQMISSLRKTPYRPRMAVLGSRDRLCIHSSITKSTKKLNINQECRIRVSNTERYRKAVYKSIDQIYDDENPPEMLDQDVMAISHDADADSDPDWTRPRSKQPMCSHYRQLGSSRTSTLACDTFVPAQDQVNNCTCGGERTKLGSHDIEELVKFGQDPYRKRNVAIYRGGKSHKVGMKIAPDKDKRRMRVVAITQDGPVKQEGSIEIGDEIVAIQGKSTIGKNLDTVCAQIGQSPDPLLLDVIRYPNAGTIDGDEDDDGDGVSPHAPCPYYISRALAKHAEVIFCPYNYVLDPFIRKSLDIELQDAVVVLDEAHNVEDVLRDSGSGKFGEIELCEIVSMLNSFAGADKNAGNLVELKGSDNDEYETDDVSVIAHELLLFVEKLVNFLISEKLRFEKSKKCEEAIADWIKFKTPDDHEFEMSYDGPSGYGSAGKTIGCFPFFRNVGLSASKAEHYRKLGEGLENHLRKSQGRESERHITLMDKLTNLIMVVSYALEHPENYYISSIAQANGSMAFASGIVPEGLQRDGHSQCQPKKMPLVWPRTPGSPNISLHACLHDECRKTQSGPNFHEGFIRHGNYCNGSTQPWEAHLVVNLLAPAMLMKDLREKCRTVILASGSLAPLSSLCAELGLEGAPIINSLPTAVVHTRVMDKPTQVTSGCVARKSEGQGKRLQVVPKPLEACHVIDLEKQLLAVSIGFFPDGSPLTANYKNQSQISFLPKLGDAIASCIESIPKGGVLVFLPSYKTLNACVKRWGGRPNQNQWNEYDNWKNDRNANTVWSRLTASKGSVIIEPTGGSLDSFEKARHKYEETIKSTGNCILFAVFRGKMSEGISFNDAFARGVICVGIPFPNAFDRAITAKKKYNDEQRMINKRHDILPGDQWYMQQAYRAIAQALGRCIRHAADYGTIVLMDSRHCDDGSPIDGVCPAHRNLPKWMRHHVRNLSNRKGGDPVLNSIAGGWPGLKNEMTRFFNEAPVHVKAVLTKQKEDFRRAQSIQGEAHMFNNETGQWASPIAEFRPPHVDSGIEAYHFPEQILPDVPTSSLASISHSGMKTTAIAKIE